MPASIKHLKHLFAKDKQAVVLFAKWPENNLYYLVKLLKLDEKKERCYVVYEDQTECWLNRRDVHIQFNSDDTPYSDSEEIFCCLCEDGTSQQPNQIVLCDVCQQGFHQDCHEPAIRQDGIDNEDEEWACQTCSYIMKQLDPMPNTSTPKVKSRAQVGKLSPRRAILKASQAKRLSRIKLSRAKADKKPSKEELEAEHTKEKKDVKKQVKESRAEPAASISSAGENDDESVPGDSSDEQPAMPLQELPDKASIDGENKIIEAAKALIENIGTNEFVSAISEKAEPKTKVNNGRKRKMPPKKPAPVPPA